MAYQKTTWVDGTTPSVSAQNLNHIESGIESVDSAVGELALSVSQLSASRLPYSDEQSTKQVIDNLKTMVTDYAIVPSTVSDDLSIILNRIGNVVIGKIGNGVATADASNTLATFPEGFRPAHECDFRDTYSNKRLLIQHSDNDLICTEALSGAIIRGMFIYFTTDDFPTT